MTKIPSVVEAIRQRHIHLKANNPVGFVHLFADIKKALTSEREAGARETTAQAELEMLKRVVEKVRELDKYDYIPVQVKEENPSAWAMYSEGRNKIFKDILASLEIINPK